MSATAEERREEREAIRRSTRVQQVYAEIAKATAIQDDLQYIGPRPRQPRLIRLGHGGLPGILSPP